MGSITKHRNRRLRRLMVSSATYKHRRRKLLSDDLGVRGKILARRWALLAPPCNAVVLCCDASAWLWNAPKPACRSERAISARAP
jgi:hypothetical protein